MQRPRRNALADKLAKCIRRNAPVFGGLTDCQRAWCNGLEVRPAACALRGFTETGLAAPPLSVRARKTIGPRLRAAQETGLPCLTNDRRFDSRNETLRQSGLMALKS